MIKYNDFLLQAQMDNNDKRSIYRLFTSGEIKNVIIIKHYVYET